MHQNHVLHIVEEDDRVQAQLAMVLADAGLETRAWTSGAAFLAAARMLRPGCVLLNIRLSDVDGVSVLTALRTWHSRLAVIAFVDREDLATAVRLMKLGAVDVLPKLAAPAHLLAAVDEVLQRIDQADVPDHHTQQARDRIAQLTHREREVLSGLMDGHSNKTIALNLGISPRTVEVYRANMMHKLGVGSLSEALHLAFVARHLH